MFGYFIVQKQDFYTPLVINKDDDKASMKCFENTVVFEITTFQYIMTCIAFSRSAPFRKPLYTNPYFTTCLILIASMTFYFIIWQDGRIPAFFEVIYKNIYLIIVGNNSLMVQRMDYPDYSSERNSYVWIRENRCLVYQ